MQNLKWEYSKALTAFVGEDQEWKWRHVVLLAPIAVPMAIMGALIDFFMGTLPDLIFGIDHGPPQPELTPEEIAVRKKRYADRLEDERKARVEEIRRQIFPNGIFPEDRGD